MKDASNGKLKLKLRSYIFIYRMTTMADFIGNLPSTFRTTVDIVMFVVVRLPGIFGVGIDHYIAGDSLQACLENPVFVCLSFESLTCLLSADTAMKAYDTQLMKTSLNSC